MAFQVRRLLVPLVCAALVLSQGAARAADTESSAAARKHFEDGSKAFNLGEFQTAISEYKAAYKAKPDPVFLYNIAQAYRLANDLPQAVFFYKSFLSNMPSAPNRREVEKRIKEAEAQIEQQKIVATTPPNTTVAPGVTPPVTEPVPEAHPVAVPVTTAPVAVSATPEQVVVAHPQKTPVYKKWWLWTAVGGVVVVGLGVGLGVGLTRSRGATAPDSHFGVTPVFP